MFEGKCIIFSAPSGSGKTTIVRHLAEVFPSLGFSISACTRPRRTHIEENGKDYHFLSPEDFISKIEHEEFIEWEQVYEGNYYGTLKSEIERLWSLGRHVIFDVDVKGGLNLKKYFGEKALAVYVRIPSADLLEERLRGRGTEDEESIKRRMFKAKFEMGFQDQFDLILDNIVLEDTLHMAENLIGKFIGER